MSNRGSSSSSSLAAPLDIHSFLHTPYYCEENVHFLCEKLCKSGMANADGSDLFVVFISNEDKQCKGNANALQEIWDLDSTLPFACPLRQYVAEAIRPSSHLNSKYSRLFRVVHAPMFLRWFASDRRHMKNPDGGWVSQPPAYEPIVAEDGAVNNLDKYIQMRAGDATENEGDKASNSNHRSQTSFITFSIPFLFVFCRCSSMAEEKHHHHHHHHHLFHHDKEEEKVAATEVGYSETTAYSDGYGSVTAAETTGYVAATESNVDYEKEAKHHKHKEHLGELGAVAAGAFALHEKHKAGKDPEHAHKHKIEEEIAAAVAVGSGGYAFHEHHEKKEAKEEEEEAHGKKHHHLF